MTNPTWAKSTGIGHWKGYVMAKGCPAAVGSSSSSYAETEGALTIGVPLHLATGAGGVNATWNFKVQASDAATISSASCPVTTVTFNYNYNYTWLNGTTSYSDCIATASVSLESYSYVYDMTNGTYFAPSNYWSGVSNTSGWETYTDSYSYNYSNSTYWAYNTSGNYSLSYSYGPSGSISGTYTPTEFINGTFNSADKYQLVTEVYAYAYADVYGYHHAAAMAHFNGGPSSGDHLRLSKVKVW